MLLMEQVVQALWFRMHVDQNVTMKVVGDREREWNRYFAVCERLCPPGSHDEIAVITATPLA
jgi:hypothetical protein